MRRTALRRKLPLEKDIQSAICGYLTYRRHFYWRNNTGAYKTEGGSFVRYGTPGSPDIICCVEGQLFGLEVKKPGGKQSENQKAFEKGLTDAGGRYHIVCSIDDVQRLGL